jgi:hypothetical protein
MALALHVCTCPVVLPEATEKLAPLTGFGMPEEYLYSCTVPVSVVPAKSEALKQDSPTVSPTSRHLPDSSRKG